MACTLRELHLRDGFFFLRTFNHPPKWRAAVDRSLDCVIIFRSILISHIYRKNDTRKERKIFGSFETNFNPKTFRPLIFRWRETIEIIIRKWRNKGIEIGNSLRRLIVMESRSTPWRFRSIDTSWIPSHRALLFFFRPWSFDAPIGRDAIPPCHGEIKRAFNAAPYLRNPLDRRPTDNRSSSNTGAKQSPITMNQHGVSSYYYVPPSITTLLPILF